MGLILLEALGALLVLALIVWWTMLSGRKGGEMAEPAEPRDDDQPADDGSTPRRGAPPRG